MFVTVIVLAGSVLAAASPTGDGVIEGVVIRAVGQTPLPGAEVVLRAKIAGQWLPGGRNHRRRPRKIPFRASCRRRRLRLSAGRQSRRRSLPRPKRAAEFSAATGRSETGRLRRCGVSQSTRGAPAHDYAAASAGRLANHGIDVDRQSRCGVLRRPGRGRRRRAGDAAAGHSRRLRAGHLCQRVLRPAVLLGRRDACDRRSLAAGRA